MKQVTYIVVRDINISHVHGSPCIGRQAIEYSDDERDKAFKFFDDSRSFYGESVRIYEVKDISDTVMAMPTV